MTVIAISLVWTSSAPIEVDGVFNHPGLGRLPAFAVSHRDLPLIQAISIPTAAGYSLANLLADIMYGLLDPQVRVNRRAGTFRSHLSIEGKYAMNTTPRFDVCGTLVDTTGMRDALAPSAGDRTDEM